MIKGGMPPYAHERAVHDSFTSINHGRFVRRPCETIFSILPVFVRKSCGRCPAENRTLVRLRRNTRSLPPSGKIINPMGVRAFSYLRSDQDYS